MRARLPTFVLLLLSIPTAIFAPGHASAETTGWKTLAFEASGAAGDWVVVRHALPSPTMRASYEVEFHLTVAAPPGEAPHALVLTPGLVWNTGGGLLPPRPPILLRPEELAGGASYQADGGAATSGGTLVEVIFAVAATHPWTLDVRFTLSGNEGGPVVSPALVTRGSGMRVVVPLDASGPAGVQTLEVAVDAPGWSHVQIASDTLHPLAARRLEARFPSGYGWDSLTSSGTPGVAGTFRDAAGTVEAALAHAEAGSDVRLLYAHVPGAGAAFDGFDPRYASTDQSPWLGGAP